MITSDTRPAESRGGRVRIGYIHEAKVPSRTTGGEYHYVKLAANGEWSCSCPGFTHHGHCWASDKERQHYEASTLRRERALAPLL